MILPESIQENVSAGFSDGILEITVKNGGQQIDDGPKRIGIEGG